MALTTTLNDAQPSGINVVNTPGGGGGFLSGLARFGAGLSNLAGDSYAKQDVAETRSAQNDAAQLAQDTLKDYRQVQESQQEGYVDLTTVPSDIMNSAKRLNRLKSSVSQGRTPETAFQLALESGIDELYRKHPERKAVIAQYFNAQGLDHYLFRDVKAQFAYAEDLQKSQQQAEEYAFDAAVKAGLVNPQTDPREVAVARGVEWLHVNAQADMAAKQLNMAKTKSDIDANERKYLEESGNRDLTQALVRDAGMRTNRLFQETMKMVEEAANDPSGQKNTDLKQAMPQIQSGILIAKQAAISQARLKGGNDATVTAVSEYYDNILESITKSVTGDLSRDSLNMKVLQGMQTQFGIDAARAFPLWNQLSKLPGMANSLPMLFGMDPASQLPKEQQDAIRKELNNWNPASPTGMYYIQRVADILRGDLKLSQMTLPEAQKVIGTVNTTVKANGGAVLQGDNTTGTVKPFLNGYEQVIDAAFTLTPGVDPKSQLKASEMLSDATSANALIKLSSDATHGFEAQQTVVSLRAAAQKGIITAKSGNWTKNEALGALPLQLVWDPTRQIVKIAIDEGLYKGYASATNMRNVNRGVVTSPMTRDQILARGDQVLADRAKTINNYLDVMVRTSRSDPNVPAGLSTTELRKAAFLGMPVDNASQAQGKDDFAARLRALEDRASKLGQEAITNEITDEQTTANRGRYEPVAHRAADQYGVPREVASFLFGQESGWNPAVGQTKIDNNNDGKPDSTAVGIGQFTKGTGKLYGLIDEKGNDFRGDANKSIDAAMKYLSDLYRKLGSWEKALEAYGVIAKSNFKNEEDYMAVLQRARAAIGNQG